MGQLPAVGKQELHGTEVAIVISGGRASSGTSPTPNVVGMSRASAEGAIQAAGFRHQVVQAHDASVAKGMIVGQVPAAGKQVDPGQDIVIAVSLGPVSKLEATVPSVNGKSKADAESAISKAGLRSLVSQLYSGAVAKGKVMGQLPRAAAKLLKNAQAAIVVSLGKHPPLDIEVPNVTGKSKADAIAALQAAELDPIETLVFTEAAGSGTIYQQLPRAGEKVKKGSRVVIVAAQ
jgi:serine/threonine-protein kinase